jgi:hypothetical protein
MRLSDRSAPFISEQGSFSLRCCVIGLFLDWAASDN